jgi:hypothetical protein
MARGRFISRSLGTSRKFGRLNEADDGMFAQALYPLLVVNSDDFGRQSGDAYTVKYAVWPTAARDEAAFEHALQALEHVGLVRRYVAEGETVLQIVDFDAHQTGLRKRTKSRFPDCPEVPDVSGNFRESPAASGNRPEIPPEEKRREQKGREQQRARKETHEERTVQEPRFDRFWEVYPRQEARASAFAQWCELGPDEAFAAQIAHAAGQYAASSGVQRSLTEGRVEFIKTPTNWLKEGAWMDWPATPAARAGPKRCRHRPRCVDDVACTARATEERNRPPTAPMSVSA